MGQFLSLGTIDCMLKQAFIFLSICAVTKTNLATLFPGSATEMIGLTNSHATFTWSETIHITDTPSHLSIIFLVFSFVILYLWWFLVNIFSHKFSVPFILFLYYSIPLCSWFTHQFLTIVPMKKKHLSDHFLFWEMDSTLKSFFNVNLNFFSWF